MAPPQHQNYGKADVIVVGAGFSGLAAATRLVSAGKSVIVLEARDRVGGKVYDKKAANGALFELGAAYIGPCQDRILALAAELGIGTHLNYSVGQSVYYNAGSRVTYDAGNLPIGADGLQQLGEAVQAIDSMALKVDAREPWSHHEARSWDSVTLASWIQSRITDANAYKVFQASIRALMSAEPEDLSLLQFVTYVGRAGNERNPGNLARLMGTTDGAQERRLVGGTQLIALRLAEKLGNQVIKLRSPVTRIDLQDGVYDVSGANFHARSTSVVMALAPPLATRITYSPPLPAGRDQMSQRMPMGSLGKAIATYDRPFWRDEGLNGHAVGINGCTVQTTFDASPNDGTSGAIIGFLEANVMRRLDSASEEDIQKLVVEDFVNFFGPKARNVKEWIIFRWDLEEYSRGGHFAICPPNVMTQFGKTIRERVGNLYFAGTEASPYWAGFMEGAIRAGESAADQICQADPETTTTSSKL
ncbi:uncharacterized protein PV06_10002 [Exophiala oligosperma]|uniref:Amine oxidase n=2 Tax=Chaetothyriales TaxID=34395 RepID=A0A0D2ACU4_9EURO|nr:uncharacterized protein PV06_10002 [Exophiala oligosperma]KAJ9639283.1 hypothetical protein H2204_003894 [Knufia peltigerae]KIW38026.1 hypothetical protein PV06_10002 [Exophiala oligosperma]